MSEADINYPPDDEDPGVFLVTTLPWDTSVNQLKSLHAAGANFEFDNANHLIIVKTRVKRGVGSGNPFIKETPDGEADSDG